MEGRPGPPLRTSRTESAGRWLTRRHRRSATGPPSRDHAAAPGHYTPSCTRRFDAGPPILHGLVSASLAMDDLIASTGVNYRALTMPSFMDNVLRQLELIRNQGVFFSAISGDRKLPTCATLDIAVIAARLLIDRSWSGQGSVPVLGPRGPLLQRHGADHVRGARATGPVPADPRRGAQGQADRKTGPPRQWPRERSTCSSPRTRASTTPSHAPRMPQPPTSFRQWCQEVLKPAVLA
jgi:hypothetical protein